MNHNHRFVRSAIGGWHVDAESVPAKPLVEICDRHRVLIEHHRGIIAYGCCEISVGVSFGKICVCGENLSLRLLCKEKLVITGSICGVTLHKEK